MNKHTAIIDYWFDCEPQTVALLTGKSAEEIKLWVISNSDNLDDSGVNLNKVNWTQLSQKVSK